MLGRLRRWNSPFETLWVPAVKLTSDPGEAGTAGMRFSVMVYTGLLSEEVTAEPQILQDRQLLPSRAACKIETQTR